MKIEWTLIGIAILSFALGIDSTLIWQDHHKPLIQPEIKSAASVSRSAYNYPGVSWEALVYINQFRQEKGLEKTLAEPQTCKFAAIRVEEIKTDWSHNGFEKRADNGTVPYFGKLTENLARRFDNPKDVVEGWKNSPVHRQELLSDTPYLCVVRSGNYWVMEGWNPVYNPGKFK